jgi:dTMP kinase
VGSQGIFITFEGTEGAGKSTLIQHIAEALRKDGHTVTVTREPGGTPVAEKIRELILGQGMHPMTELFLYEAARAEHLETTIRPALIRGEVVLCDRFADSSLAYQGHARGLPWKQVKTLNRIATRKLKPHLTFFLDLDPAVGLKRASHHNRFELEGLEFQQKVRQGFLKARSENPSRWLILKVEGRTPDDLCRQAMERIRKRFRSKLRVK